MCRLDGAWPAKTDSRGSLQMKDERSSLRTLLMWGALFLVFVAVFQLVKQSGKEEDIPFSQLMTDARTFFGEGQPLSGVKTVCQKESTIYGEKSEGGHYSTDGRLDDLGDQLLFLLRKGVRVDYGDSDYCKTLEVPADSYIPFDAFARLALSIPTTVEGTGFVRSVLRSVEGKGDAITIKYQNGETKKSSGKLDPVISELMAYGITVKQEPEEEAGFWAQFLISWVPMIFLVLLFFFFIRQMQAGGGKAMSFGKSRHRMMADGAKRITFADIAGIEEAKEELHEIVEFLKDPKKFTRLGGRIPRGVLLMGPPGTGKTLLARGVAGEAGVPFFSISGSDFVEMFVGVGASRVRDLFEQGKKNAPCIIFIDEIDAVGRHRGAGLGGGHDEREQTLNQLLVEMDGFEGNEGVILVAATNRPDVLDPALLRPGRFDRRVVIPLPDLNGRHGILKVHSRSKPMAEGIDLERLARGTPGFSGADLENLMNEAALLAARRDGQTIETKDLEEAKDKVMMGTARRSMALTAEEKRSTAYHEAGHALVARMVDNADPLYKVTIIPRGVALGLTQFLPEKDKHGYTKSWLEDMMAVTMGGRAAEEIVYNEMTTGAGQDIQQVTAMARRMVTEWGMSTLGPIAYDSKADEVFLGRDFAKAKSYSDSAAQRIDREVKHLVMTAYERAHSILVEHRKLLDRLSEALLAKESLGFEEMEAIVLEFGIPAKKLPENQGDAAQRA